MPAGAALSLNSLLSLFQALPIAPFLPARRPNCKPLFEVSIPDVLIYTSASPFITNSWLSALRNYPGSLASLIGGILTYEARLGVSETHDMVGRRVKNQVPAELDTSVVTTSSATT